MTCIRAGAKASVLLALSLLLAASCGQHDTGSGPSDGGASPSDAAAVPPDASSSCPTLCGVVCCAPNQVCNRVTLTCEVNCQPQCGGKQCGSDGCGGSCGMCFAGSTCSGTGQCVACQPQCSGKACGDDGCGGSCGTCGEGLSCSGGVCMTGGIPDDAGTAIPPDAGTVTAPDAGTVIAPDASTIPADAGRIRPDASTLPDDAGTTGGGVPATACAPWTPTYNRNFASTDWCDQVARVICDRLENCCARSPSTYTACLSEYRESCNSGQNLDTQARLNAGVLKLNLTNARACLDAEASRFVCSGTDKDRLVAPECATALLLSPGSPSGGNCFSRIDCTNQRCTRASGSCGGKCAAWLGVGATCNTDDLACDPATLYCKLPSSTSPTGTCMAVVPTGQACTANFECAAGDFCDTKASHACKRAPTLGDACLRTDQCALGTCTGTCTRPYSIPIGGTCGTNTDCVTSGWCRGGTSTTFGVCTAFTSPGQTCSGGGSSPECGPAASCYVGACRAKGGTGATCATSSDCLFGMYCASGVCRNYGDVNDTCASNADCKFALRCDLSTGKCTATPGGSGAACTIDEQCSAGLYCNGASCVDRLGNGQFCGGSNSNASCLSGDCEPPTGSTSGTCRTVCTY